MRAGGGVDNAAGICFFIGGVNVLVGSLAMLGVFSSLVSGINMQVLGLLAVLEGSAYFGLGTGIKNESRGCALGAAILYSGTTFLLGAGGDASFAVVLRVILMGILWWGVFDVLELKDLDRQGEERHRQFEAESRQRRTLRHRNRDPIAFASSGAHRAVSSSSSRREAVEPRGPSVGGVSWSRDGRLERLTRVTDRALCPNCRETYPRTVDRCRICKVSLFAND